jgi:hypothetical protein
MDARTIAAFMREAHGDPDSAFQLQLGHLAYRIREHANSVRMHEKQRRKLRCIADDLDLLVRVAGQLDLPDPPVE